MRKVTKAAVQALRWGYNFKQGNTRVEVDEQNPNVVKMYLHGNLIASREYRNLTVYDGGWESNTTKERLNGILDYYGLGYILQKDFAWYFYNFETSKQEPWTGSLALQIKGVY